MNFIQDPAGLVASVRTLGARSAHHIQVVQRRMKDLDVSVFQMDGMLRGREPARVLYAGRVRMLEEIRPFLFKGPVEVHAMGSATPINLQHRLAALSAPQVDILLWEAWPWETSDPAGTTNQSYVVQAWLDARADPGKDWQAYLDGYLSENTRRGSVRADKAGFDLKVSTDVAEHEMFFHQMLLPMSKHLFGNEGRAPERAAYFAFCKDPGTQVLTLKRDGVLLAGALLHRPRERRELALLYYGALPTVLDDPSLRRDVMAALNTWVFREACAAKLKVNMALTRPFLDDGVFNHKRQWGCWLQALPAFGRYRLQFASARAHDLMQIAPFFHLTVNGVCGVMVFSPREPDPVRELRTLLSRAVFPGLRGITVKVRGWQSLVDQLSAALPTIKGCPVTYESTAQPQHDRTQTADDETTLRAREFEVVTADISIAGALARSGPGQRG